MAATGITDEQLEDGAVLAGAVASTVPELKFLNVVPDSFIARSVHMIPGYADKLIAHATSYIPFK